MFIWLMNISDLMYRGHCFEIKDNKSVVKSTCFRCEDVLTKVLFKSYFCYVQRYTYLRFICKAMYNYVT